MIWKFFCSHRLTGNQLLLLYFNHTIAKACVNCCSNKLILFCHLLSFADAAAAWKCSCIAARYVMCYCRSHVSCNPTRCGKIKCLSKRHCDVIGSNLVTGFWKLNSISAWTYFNAEKSVGSDVKKSITSSFFNRITFHLAARCTIVQKINV